MFVYVLQAFRKMETNRLILFFNLTAIKEKWMEKKSFSIIQIFIKNIMLKYRMPKLEKMFKMLQDKFNHYSIAWRKIKVLFLSVNLIRRKPQLLLSSGK